MPEQLNVGSNGSLEEKEKFKNDYEIFLRTKEILKTLGFSTIDRFTKEMCEKDWENERSIPLVEDGLMGVRISFSKHRNPIVWFTNGFENPEYPRRQEVISIMIKSGLGDYVNKLGYIE